jgi:hypothetical protein
MQVLFLKCIGYNQSYIAKHKGILKATTTHGVDCNTQLLMSGSNKWIVAVGSATAIYYRILLLWKKEIRYLKEAL